MTYGLKSYQSTRAKTASREDLLIMLYEGAIRFLERSLVAYKEGQLAEHKMLLMRGRAIVEEFQNSLNMEVGGDLARQLDGLYVYMLKALTTANMRKSMAEIEEVIGLLTTLLEGWRGAVQVVKQEQQSGVVDATPPQRGTVRPLPATTA
jgi:flagellar protein FliS